MSFLSDLKDKVFADNVDETVSEVTIGAVTVDVVVDSTPEPKKVDIAAQLDGLNANNPEDLNWRTSIVDLLKLTGMDSSYGARKELAADVGLVGYEGTAENNIALHKAVLVNFSEQGGSVPAELII